MDDGVEDTSRDDTSRDDTSGHDKNAAGDTDQAAETGTPAESSSTEPRLSPAFIATLVAIPVMVIAGFIIYAAVRFSDPADAPSPIESYATGPESSRCTDFISALPDRLGDFGDKSVDGTTVRWSKDGSEPVVLKCGVERPTELAPTSKLQVIDPVQWFMTDTLEERGQAYVSVDHRPYVAMWMPVGAGNAPITDVSTLIATKLPAAPLDFG